MSGTIAEVQRKRGTGSLLGKDGKIYSFRRSDLRDVWFHELMEGATVTFVPGKNCSATQVRVSLIPSLAPHPTN